MQTQWGAWLAAEAAAKRGGIVLADGIVRDTPFSLELNFGADYSGDAFKAALAVSPDAASPLVTMTVNVSSFVNNTTTVTCSLTKAQVNALPADGDFDGLGEVLFDLLRTPSGGTQKRFLALSIPVSGKVTPGD